MSYQRQHKSKATKSAICIEGTSACPACQKSPGQTVNESKAAVRQQQQQNLIFCQFSSFSFRLAWFWFGFARKAQEWSELGQHAALQQDQQRPETPAEHSTSLHFLPGLSTRQQTERNPKRPNLVACNVYGDRADGHGPSVSPCESESCAACNMRVAGEHHLRPTQCA